MQPIDRFRIQLVTESVQPGQFCRYRFFAAHEWVYLDLAPQYPVESVDHPILCDLQGRLFILYYHGGRFRNSSGSPWPNPTRWAYIRLVEDKWNGQGWELGDSGVAPPATKPSAVQLLTLLGQYYSKTEIMDVLDTVPTNDGPGAPV